MPNTLHARWAPWAWPWPLPAAGAWLAAWAVFAASRSSLGAAAAALLALLAGIGMAWPLAQAWRRVLVAGGFPLSALATGWAGGLPAWAWLLPLLALAAAYPLRAWRDAPWFPTPTGALDALAARLPLDAGARVIDAGCGAGDGLQALHRAWPQAAVEGVEWSAALAWLARRRCPWAAVVRADMWARPWRGAALVYVFQRPESMARAWAKACAELAPGAWLVSLDFAVPGREPDLQLPSAGRHVVLGWRVPPPQPGRAPASVPLNHPRSAPITPGNAWAVPPRVAS